MARRRGRQKRKEENSSSSSNANVEHLLSVLEVRAFVVVVVVYVVVEIFQNAIFRNSFLFGGGPSLLLSLVVLHALTLSSLSLYLSLSVSLVDYY